MDLRITFASQGAEEFDAFTRTRGKSPQEAFFGFSPSPGLAALRRLDH
jgi:hypothetical protein